jgi:hypothetical protein
VGAGEGWGLLCRFVWAKGFNLLGKGVTAGSQGEDEPAVVGVSGPRTACGVHTLEPVGYAIPTHSLPPSLTNETCP